MPASPSNLVVIDIAAFDICDSISRVVADVQRFGWTLNEIVAVASPANEIALKLAVSAASHVELAHIEDRLARHPSIIAVQARSPAEDDRRAAS